MKEDAVSKVGLEAPSWLVEVAQGDTSLEEVKKSRRLQRLKIAQGNTPAAKALIKEVGEGTVVLSGDKTIIARKEERFALVPLFMFREYTKIKDRLDKSEGTMFLERTFDKESRIAILATSKNKKDRFERYGEVDGSTGRPMYEARYVEHLVFPSVLYPSLTPVTLSFEKGEHFTGENFCGGIMNRKVGADPAPLYTQVWDLWSEDHTWQDNAWLGFGFGAPQEYPPFITQEEYADFKKLHMDLGADFRAKALDVDYSEDEETVVEDDDEL